MNSTDGSNGQAKQDRVGEPYGLMPGEQPSSASGGSTAPHAEMPRPRGDTGMSGSVTTPGDTMPTGKMSDSTPNAGTSSAMPGGGMDGSGAKQSVLIEMRVPPARAVDAAQLAASIGVPGLQVDPSFEPVPMRSGLNQPGARGTEEETVIVRGLIDPGQIAEIERQPNVLRVYQDTIVMPFATAVVEEHEAFVLPMEPTASCPIGTCDCTPGTAKATIAQVATYLGADQVWGAGYRGDGIVVGVVDGGITAIGRTPKPGETARINRVISGFPADWGTTATAWGDHGNMVATDVLGMAPNAQIYDIRISGGGIAATIGAALQGFQWAINQHRSDGTPHVLTNSWGIFQETWDTVYARDPNHPFTRKVVEAMDEGILVLFAAGNCGATCPDGRCGADNGPGRSIWGANSHPRVMTVGAVNVREELAGYSSQGPGALEANKPDFCSVTHFQGYFASDSGTSAATPIAAGVVALLKQANPALRQDDMRTVLRATAKDIGPAGWDQHSGTGIIRAKAAYDAIVKQWYGWESLGGYCLYDPAAASWDVNRIDTFVIGSDQAMWHKWWDGNTWQGWESLGGYCLYGTAVASWAADRLDCFVIGGDGAVWHKWWDGNAWQGWESLGGYCISAPSAVSWGPNRIDLFVLGTDRAMWHKWWDGNAWQGWESLGGFCISAPAVASWADNRLDCFVTGSDHAMWHKWWDGNAWQGWESLGGYCLSGPGTVSWGPERIDSFVVGSDHAMWHKWYG